MNIAIGLVSLQPGGTELQMHLLANSLVSRGHKVTIYLTTNSPDSPMSPRYYSVRHTIHKHIHHIPSILELSYEWRKWLLTDKPDILVGALILPHTVFNISSLGLHIPIIARRGFSWPEILPLPNYSAAFKRVRMVRYFTMFRTNTLVCNADHVLNSAQRVEGWPIHKLTLIRNGWPEYPANSYASLRTVYSGLNRIEKDFSIPGVERITTIPYWPNIGIYVHPTQADGSSNSIGMAMAHAIPVIARRIPGNIELLGKDYSGLVDNELQIDRWLRILEKSDSTRRYLGTVCQNRIRAYYPLKSMVDNWELLLSLVKGECHETSHSIPYKDMVTNSSFIQSSSSGRVDS